MRKALFSIITILFCATTLAQDFKRFRFYRRSDGKTEPLPFAQVYLIEEETDRNR